MKNRKAIVLAVGTVIFHAVVALAPAFAGVPDGECIQQRIYNEKTGRYEWVCLNNLG